MSKTTTPERHEFEWDRAAGLSNKGICTCGEHEDDPAHDPAVKVTHVAIGQGIYYNATSEEAAKAGFRRQGGRLSKSWTMVHFPEGVTYLGTNNMGALSWRYDTDPHVEPVLTEHKGR